MNVKSGKSKTQTVPRKEAGDKRLDREYLAAVQSTLSEWTSAEDAAAYDELMGGGKQKSRKKQLVSARSGNFGWSDPIGALERLRDAVHTIARGKGIYRERMDAATFALIFLRPEDVPRELRGAD